MNKNRKKKEEYRGFEQGPIRPPSESHSLLIRVTRNCPWNRCTFCPVYKDARFSLRPPEHVMEDIDQVSRHVESLRKLMDDNGRIDRADLSRLAARTPLGESQAFNAAVHWFSGGMRSIFLQDANSLIMPPSELIQILQRLKDKFYWVERITSYARSHTIARIKDENLAIMYNAGLNRIHIGLESGSDKVLKIVDKGVVKATHIKAGKKVKKAGMQLSEYFMPGLGGKRLSEEHAKETADALNQINPDFIRLRSLAIPNIVPLYKQWRSGEFEKCTDVEMAKEILLFIDSLEGITSKVRSDHVLNLFEDVRGELPQDKDKMTSVLKSFLDLPPKQKCLYQVGRRLGIFRSLSDMNSSRRLARVEKTCEEHGITPENVENIIDELMKRFI